MKNKKVTDQITFRAEAWQLKRLEDLEQFSPKDLKKSAVVRAALRYYFGSKDARLPTGELLSDIPAPYSVELPTTRECRPVRLQKKKGDRPDAASA